MSSGIPASARPIVIRSSSAIASTIAIATPSALQRGDALADCASAPARTTSVVDQADLRVASARCSTRTRFASVIGVSG